METWKVVFLLHTFCLLGLLTPTPTKADPNLLEYSCTPEEYTTGDNTPALSTNHQYDDHAPNHTTTTFLTELSTALFTGLSTDATALTNGFYSFTTLTPTYGLFLCRGDLSPADCLDCIVFATQDVAKLCPRSKQVVTIWYSECMLRYSNVSIIATLDVSGGTISLSEQTRNETGFGYVVREVMESVVARASSGDSGKKFATKEANFSTLQSVYSLAQCTPDLSASDCSYCLSESIGDLRGPSFNFSYQGGQRLLPSCIVRYDIYQFYGTSTTTHTALLPPLLPPPVLPTRSPPPVLPTRSPPPVLSPPHPPTSSPGKKKISPEVLDLIAIIVPIGVSILLYTACFCYISRKAKKKFITIKEDTVEIKITTTKSLQYDLGMIKAATNNFSDENKIGGGGFGPLYKGLLADGQAIAVKRLSRTLVQDLKEFKDAVALILGVDKTRGKESEIVRTSGYMSPEYTTHGQWSTKSDVFSFGVLVLEIITGKKNNFSQSAAATDLLSYVWNLWSGETPLDLMDATMKGTYSRDEVIRCIHIALLCVQEDPNARPPMAMVVPMLDGYSTVMSIPQEPGFFARSITNIELDQCANKSIVWSVNEVSITELQPR
ncbi:hypothetical protein Vadar_031766 [Vaccinium darrowii]|uniref:Uncharacterized protein n=1 Tax=Vaccinium darrowii TaxID=229202 RepID=A0ACB7ZN38_9ERIC|nr:hypothetical protein Vadar_031766 [Vaccinium darrowii]